ncbi:MAG: hypothetical protein ACTSRK_01000 [Promethearchaeota archaeon]
MYEKDKSCWWSPEHPKITQQLSRKMIQKIMKKSCVPILFFNFPSIIRKFLCFISWFFDIFCLYRRRTISTVGKVPLRIRDLAKYPRKFLSP